MVNQKTGKKVTEHKHVMCLDGISDDLYYGLKIASKEHHMSLNKFAKLILASYVDQRKVSEKNIRKITRISRKK